MKRGPFGEKKTSEKEFHNAEILKGGTLWAFSTTILSQNIKKLKGGKLLFPEKKLQCQKKLKRGTLWDFPTSILTQKQKIDGGTLWGKFFPKKSLAVPKKN